MEEDSLDKIPMYSTGLIEKLDKLYPHKCIQPGEKRDNAIAYSGKRELIDTLLFFIKETGEDMSVINGED